MECVWTVYIEKAGVSQGRIDHAFIEGPRVGARIRFDRPPIAGQPAGWYLITSVNPHSHIATIEPAAD